MVKLKRKVKEKRLVKAKVKLRPRVIRRPKGLDLDFEMRLDSKTLKVITMDFRMHLVIRKRWEISWDFQKQKAKERQRD